MKLNPLFCDYILFPKFPSLRKFRWEAQYQVLRAVNKEMMALYWDIGHLIAERQSIFLNWAKSMASLN